MGLISIFIGAIELIVLENIVILVQVWVIKNQVLGVLLKKLCFFGGKILFSSFEFLEISLLVYLVWKGRGPLV